MSAAAQPPNPSPQLSDSNRAIIDPSGPSKRIYQVWKGSNRFFLSGRLIFGPDVSSLVFTVFLIITPVILFAVFVSERLVNEFQHDLGCLIIAIAVVFTVYRNYRLSFMFVSSTTLWCLYVFAFCWVNIKKIMDAYHCNLWRAFMRSPVSGILILYTFLGAWFVGGLTAFHLYLIYTNQTTYENFRYRYDGKLNPYNHGWAQNVMEIFFTRIPSSKNHFRAKVTEDSSTFNPTISVHHALSPDMAKTSLDVEMGSKRQAVAAEEFEDIQNQMGLERCRT